MLIGFIFGLFQTGYFYGKTQGVDIRKMGSGNAGSTNALRTMGIKAGMITLLGDCFKCVIAVLVVRGIYGQSHADILPLLSLYTGFGAVLGHNFPFYLKFKGGKGIEMCIRDRLITAISVAFQKKVCYTRNRLWRTVIARKEDTKSINMSYTGRYLIWQ